MKVCPKCNIEHNKNGLFCSRSCANSRTWSEEDKRKKSESSKKWYSKNTNAMLGKPGWKHSEEMKNLKREISLKWWDERGRRSKEEKRIQNLIGVSNYRARKNKATPKDCNHELIKEIYKMCPKGYEVDHIIAIAEGGLHHQDNLQYLPAMENRKKNRTQNYNRSFIVRWQDIIK